MSKNGPVWYSGEQERFGFLRESVEFEFEGGALSLLPGYTNTFERFERETMWDETFYYPPIIPGTERVARLFRLPASHALHLAAREPSAVRRNGCICLAMARGSSSRVSLRLTPTAPVVAATLRRGRVRFHQPVQLPVDPYWWSPSTPACRTSRLSSTTRSS